VAVELHKAEAFPSRWIDLACGTWGKCQRIFRADGGRGNYTRLHAMPAQLQKPILAKLKTNREVPMEQAPLHGGGFA
jgi:hypothetical protein